MELTTILYEVSDGTAWVRLNRPEAKNALTRDSYRELTTVFRDAHNNPEVRCVVVTGNGTAFCSGDDVKQVMLNRPVDPDSDRPRSVDIRPKPTPTAMAIFECNKPVIAAVNGAAVGWGMDLALLCDIRIAAENARFGELFVKRGLVADVGGMWCLPRIVGPSKAAELLLTGEILDASEALAIGLVSRVVPAEQLLSSCGELAAKIAANPPLAVAHIKEGLRMSANATIEQMGTYVGTSLRFLFTTEDHREGALSFIERRAPTFKGR